MIRLGTLAWLVVLALLGIGLFQVKYEVQAREDELHKLRRQVEANLAVIRVLEAEWSYLNDPPRLADLARRHTELAPTTPSQIRDFAELPARLPDVAPPLGQTPPLVGEAVATTPPAPAPEDDAVIDAILADMHEDEGETGGAPLGLPARAGQGSE